MTGAMANGALSLEAVCRGGINERESQTLAALRDTLLPKLISGEFKLAKGQSNG
jgi:hypothetical protein